MKPIKQGNGNIAEPSIFSTIPEKEEILEAYSTIFGVFDEPLLTLDWYRTTLLPSMLKN